MQTIVMKFGGASVATPSSFEHIAKIIEESSKKYDSIVVVVSAMGDMTDQLISMAKEVNPNPDQREVDMLISVGERVSISLLAMALQKRGLSAFSFTGSQSGVITSSEHGKARIIDVKPKRLIPHLLAKEIVIVAGFQGVSADKNITTLGRGGSDTSAVALGVALDAQKVLFYKDVLGIYSDDPKKDLNATLYQELSYGKALELMNQDSPVLHPRCVKLAQKNALPLNVLSFNNYSEPGTLVGNLSQTRQPSKVYE